MRKHAIRTTAAALGVSLSAFAFPLAIAPDASASGGTCVKYIHGKGYKVGPHVRHACAVADDSKGGSKVERKYAHETCYAELKKVGVQYNYANKACTLGQK